MLEVRNNYEFIVVLLVWALNLAVSSFGDECRPIAVIENCSSSYSVEVKADKSSGGEKGVITWEGSPAESSPTQEAVGLMGVSGSKPPVGFKFGESM